MHWPVKAWHTFSITADVLLLKWCLCSLELVDQLTDLFVVDSYPLQVTVVCGMTK